MGRERRAEGLGARVGVLPEGVEVPLVVDHGLAVRDGEALGQRGQDGRVRQPLLERVADRLVVSPEGGELEVHPRGPLVEERRRGGEAFLRPGHLVAVLRLEEPLAVLAVAVGAAGLVLDVEDAEGMELRELRGERVGPSRQGLGEERVVEAQPAAPLAAGVRPLGFGLLVGAGELAERADAAERLHCPDAVPLADVGGRAGPDAVREQVGDHALAQHRAVGEVALAPPQQVLEVRVVGRDVEPAGRDHAALGVGDLEVVGAGPEGLGGDAETGRARLDGDSGERVAAPGEGELAREAVLGDGDLALQLVAAPHVVEDGERHGGVGGRWRRQLGGRELRVASAEREGDEPAPEDGLVGPRVGLPVGEGRLELGACEGDDEAAARRVEGHEGLAVDGGEHLGRDLWLRAMVAVEGPRPRRQALAERRAGLEGDFRAAHGHVVGRGGDLERQDAREVGLAVVRCPPGHAEAGVVLAAAEAVEAADDDNRAAAPGEIHELLRVRGEGVGPQVVEDREPHAAQRQVHAQRLDVHRANRQVRAVGEVALEAMCMVEHAGAEQRQARMALAPSAPLVLAAEAVLRPQPVAQHEHAGVGRRRRRGQGNRQDGKGNHAPGSHGPHRGPPPCVWRGIGRGRTAS